MTPRRVTFALLIVLLACMVAGAQRVLIDRRAADGGEWLSYTSGIHVRYEGANLSGLSNGGDIDTLVDSSGNDYHSWQTTTAKKPHFVSSLVNGLGGWSFDGTEYFYVSNCFGGLSEAEIFIVFKNDADAPATDNDSYAINGGSQDYVPYSDGTIYDGFGWSIRNTTVNPTPDTSSAFRLYNVSAGSNWTNRLDTVDLYGTAVGSFSMAKSVKTYGVGTDGSISGWKSDHALLIIYDHVLTPANRATVESDIKSHFGLTGY